MLDRLGAAAQSGVSPLARSETIVAVDIGGTHVRFALASKTGGGIALGPATTLVVADHPTFAAAWQTFARQQAHPLPRAAAIAVAGPVEGDVVRLTNNGWTIDRRALGTEIGVDGFVLLNDFAAVAHAAAVVSPAELAHLAGPDTALPAGGVISVIGPGTGLGVAQVVPGGDRVQVVATEGGHIGFAPRSPLDDRVLAALRLRHERVSVERVVAGSGLRAIYQALAGADIGLDDAALWQAGLADDDALAAQAIAEFCRILGAVAGDIALAQGAAGVVIGGGLGLRLAKILPASPFAAAFADKGRFAARMAAIPVRLITHPQPGLLGAVAAFASG